MFQILRYDCGRQRRLDLTGITRRLTEALLRPTTPTSLCVPDDGTLNFRSHRVNSESVSYCNNMLRVSISGGPHRAI